MKKLLGLTLGVMAAAAVIISAPSVVKAEGMPCTELTLKEFQANKDAALKELAQVQAQKAAADAKVEQLKAQGVTGLELQQATDAAFNAANLVTAYQYKVNNCQIAINNISGRGSVEQYYLDMEEKWKGRCAIDNTKGQLDGALQITAAAMERVNTLKTALVNQQANAAVNPGYAANVAQIQAELAAAEADYAAKKATSDALQAQYQQQMATLNWATNEDNAAWGAFVANWGSGMKTDVKEYDKDGNEVVVYSYYGDYHQTEKPNEWSIRWFR